VLWAWGVLPSCRRDQLEEQPAAVGPLAQIVQIQTVGQIQPSPAPLQHLGESVRRLPPRAVGIQHAVDDARSS
jgi:hypothetical protein